MKEMVYMLRLLIISIHLWDRGVKMTNNEIFELIDGIQNYLDILQLYRNELNKEDLRKLRKIRSTVFQIYLSHYHEGGIRLYE